MSRQQAELATISDQIMGIEGVSRILSGGEVVFSFVNGLSAVRQYAYILVIALGLLAVFLIANTIRVTIYSRRREISIMRTVGASNWFIRLPFLVEGMIIGLLGSLIPVVVIIFGYQYIYGIISSGLNFSLLQLPPVYPLVSDISWMIIGLGIGVGLVGSFISISKHLRWSR